MREHEGGSWMRFGILFGGFQMVCTFIIAFNTLVLGNIFNHETIVFFKLSESQSCLNICIGILYV